MTDLNYGLSSFDRDRGNFPKLPVVNMFVEQVPTEPTPVLQSRPGLENAGITMGSGPVEALLQIDGVLNGALFGISAGHLYQSGVDKGAINGTGPVSIAGFPNRVFACAGLSAWQFDGAALSAIAMPGGFNVLSLCVGSDRLIVIDSGTGKFYWSDVLSTTVDALSFATAENSPDNLKECLFLGDTLILFGSETVEQWPASSANPLLPFTPLVGRTFQVGIRGTGCATLFQNAFAWITNENQICVSDPTNVISTPSIDEKISQSATASLWTFRLEGIPFLAVTLDSRTYVFSASSSTWSEFQSYGHTNWIPQCFANGYFGSSIDGRIVRWSDDHADFGDILERRFRAGTPLTSGTAPLNNVILRTNPGQTPYLSGDYAEPTVELRTSRDGGMTWGIWHDRSLGESGHYKKNIMWRSLGRFGYPGILVEIRVTDPVPFRASGLVANEDFQTI